MFQNININFDQQYIMFEFNSAVDKTQYNNFPRK